MDILKIILFILLIIFIWWLLLYVYRKYLKPKSNSITAKKTTKIETSVVNQKNRKMPDSQAIKPKTNNPQNNVEQKKEHTQNTSGGFTTSNEFDEYKK